MTNHNPLTYVQDATTAGASQVAVPCPSSYKVKYSDISDSDAGRTEDGKMHKEMIAQKVHIELEWAYLKTNDVAAITNAFNYEYINVKYFDPMRNADVVKKFYVGDRTVESYSTRLGVWTSVSFNIIEQ